MTASSYTTTISADAQRINNTDTLPDGVYAQALCNIAADMARNGETETWVVECDYSDDRGEDDLAITGSRLVVIYIDAIGRAMIHTNGGDGWTDAASVEDALARYANDELAN